MTGAEIVAIISVSAGALTTCLATCFHSRCTKLKLCWGGIECDRDVLDAEEIEAENRRNQELNNIS